MHLPCKLVSLLAIKRIEIVYSKTVKLHKEPSSISKRFLHNIGEDEDKFGLSEEGRIIRPPFYIHTITTKIYSYIKP